MQEGLSNGAKCFGNLGVLDLADDSVNACTQVAALELQDNDNYCFMSVCSSVLINLSMAGVCTLILIVGRVIIPATAKKKCRMSVSKIGKSP